MANGTSHLNNRVIIKGFDLFSMVRKTGAYSWASYSHQIPDRRLTPSSSECILTDPTMQRKFAADAQLVSTAKRRKHLAVGISPRTGSVQEARISREAAAAFDSCRRFAAADNNMPRDLRAHARSYTLPPLHGCGWNAGTKAFKTDTIASLRAFVPL